MKLKNISFRPGADKPVPWIKALGFLLIFLFVLSLSACSSLILKPADFSWPVESVLTVNDDGFVKEDRHSIIFDARKLFLEETGDSTAYMNKELRLIRDAKGYYYMTANNFKNVYVFKTAEGKLTLDEKIEISKTGITNPAFNQRLPNIELVDGDQKHMLNNDGIIKENEEKNEK